MKSKMRINSLGDKVWENSEGNLHREDGPAIIHLDGSEGWYFDGKPHRKGGPAIIYSDDNKIWYLNDKLHREDGPAIENCSGYNGYNRWYLDGIEYTEKGYKQKMRFKKIKDLLNN